MQNITSFLKYFLLKILFPVETRQFLVNPNRSKWKKCCNQRKDKILIIPFEDFAGRQDQKKIKRKKQTVDIPHDDDVNRWGKRFPVVADPDHCGKKKAPGNGFEQANLLKPFDDLFFRIF